MIFNESMYEPRRKVIYKNKSQNRYDKNTKVDNDYSSMSAENKKKSNFEFNKLYINSFKESKLSPDNTSLNITKINEKLSFKGESNPVENQVEDLKENDKDCDLLSQQS